MKELIKAVFTTGVGSAVSMIMGMITCKTLAFVTGPSGMGLYSIVRQFIETGSTVATFGSNVAIVQKVPSQKGDKKAHIIHNAFFIVLVGTMLVSIIVFCFTDWFAIKILSNKNNIGIIYWAVIAVVASAFLSLFTSILNGLHKIKELAIIQVVGGIVVASLAYGAGQFFNNGMLQAIPLLLFAGGFGGLLCALFFLKKNLDVSFFGRPSFYGVVQILQFSSATLISSLSFIFGLLLVKKWMLQYGGLTTVGLFDVAWTVGMTYLMIILSSFGKYYLPKLAASDSVQKQELFENVLLFSSLVFIPVIVSMIALKPFAITLLYSDKFTSSLDTLRWMLVGDYMKIAGWCFDVILLATANLKIYVIKQVLLNVTFYVGCYIFISAGFFEGIGVAYIIMYALNLLFLYIYIIKKYELIVPSRINKIWLTGFVLILMSSFLCWQDYSVNLCKSFSCISISFLVSILSLNMREREAILILVKQKYLRAFCKTQKTK